MRHLIEVTRRHGLTYKKTNTKTMANTLRESNAILETYNLRGLFSLMKTCDLTNKTPMTQTNTKTKISKSNHR